jgi:hypothetical protein
MRPNRTAAKIWNQFQGAPTNAERQERGFYFATCPGCRIIFSMRDAQEQEAIARLSCSVCRTQKRRGEVA